MTDLFVQAAERRTEEARHRLRVAPHGSVRRRTKEVQDALHDQLAAEMKVSTAARRH